MAEAIGSINPVPAGSAASSADRPDFGYTTRIATYGALLLFAALFAFAAMAPISGGAIAIGTVNPDGSRRVVQHFEGGIISDILVRDGDVVQEGDPLIILNRTQALADRNISRARLQTLKIMEARLTAEMAGRRTMDLSGIDFSADPRLSDVARSETELLEKSIDLSRAKIDLLREREQQYRSEIQGLSAAIESLGQQRDLLNQEIESAQVLVEKQLYAEPRLLALKREEAALSGQILTNQSDILRIEGQISEIVVQRSEMVAERRSQIAEQIAEIRGERVQTEEVFTTNEETLARTTVSAPIHGTIVELRYKTLGGVVGPGEPILDIVPLTDELIIEAQVLPGDVDIVSPGLTARVTFSTLRRDLPQIEGIVTRISADAILEERTGMTYFRAEVSVPRETLEALQIADKITPGIPADVMIVTETRTVLDYLIQPLRDSMRRAFKETN
ncbi:MAG: HlyD family type I secretion periplasmic adaptor subunit [Hyphomonadaceae bacterium]|nr:HlyD family type I secretion periplasmic adaptor subunit [Hyphomonadaceae bacterium]